MIIPSQNALREDYHIELPLPKQNLLGNRVVKFLSVGLLVSPSLLIAYGLQVASCAIALPFVILKLAISTLVLIATFFAGLGKEDVRVRWRIEKVKEDSFRVCFVFSGLILPIVVVVGYVRLYEKLNPVVEEKREYHTVYQGAKENYVDVQPPLVFLAGRTVSLNVQAMRKKRDVKTLTSRDLPSEVDLNIFNEIFSNLDRHLQTLSEYERICFRAFSF